MRESVQIRTHQWLSKDYPFILGSSFVDFVNAANYRPSIVCLGKLTYADSDMNQRTTRCTLKSQSGVLKSRYETSEQKM